VFPCVNKPSSLIISLWFPKGPPHVRVFLKELPPVDIGWPRRKRENVVTPPAPGYLPCFHTFWAPETKCGSPRGFPVVVINDLRKDRSLGLYAKLVFKPGCQPQGCVTTFWGEHFEPRTFEGSTNALVSPKQLRFKFGPFEIEPQV